MSPRATAEEPTPARRLVAPTAVAVGEHQLSVWRCGAGRPVLFLHGIPTSSSLWRHVQPMLVDVADTIAVDLLGYGRSDKPPSVHPDLPTQAMLMSRLLDQWDLEDVVVVGHDIGGGVAQLLALRAGARVGELVLVASVAYDSFPEPTIARLADPEWDRRIHQVDLTAGFERALRKGTTPDRISLPDVARLYAAPFDGPDGRAAYLRAARAVRTSDLADVMPAVEELTIPVHLVWGAEDPFQPVRYGERLQRALQHADLTVVPAGSHFLPEDHPQVLVELLRRILAGSGRRTDDPKELPASGGGPAAPTSDHIT